jgi:hypothetical protein
MFPDSTELERLRYRQGQRLRSRDFRDQAAIDAQMRWWHNRALHNAYGIARGLEATMSSDGGTLVVQIASGVAYDCFGRELNVQQERTVRVPEAAENLALLLRFKEWLSDSAGRRAVCIPASCALVETAELVWMPSHGLTFKDGVVVCRSPAQTSATIALSVTMTDLVLAELSGKGGYEKNALVVRGVLSRDKRDALLALPHEVPDRLAGLDLGAYRRAIFDLFERSQIDYGRSKGRVLARPRIATGATIAGSTAWTPWWARDLGLIGLQVEIDASTAGFTEAPCYFASLQGLPLEGTGLVFEHTDRASSTGFVFRFWGLIPMRSRVVEKDPESGLLALARRLKLFVRWCAVQRDPAIDADVVR